MTQPDTTDHISINLGGGHTANTIAAKISIGTTAPIDVGAGCTVYSFSNGQLKHTDILFMTPGETVDSVETVQRVRSHSDSSPLDIVCVEAIKTHFNGNPPNEVFCKLEKLDPVGVRNLSITAPPPNEVLDVTPEAKEQTDE